MQKFKALSAEKAANGFTAAGFVNQYAQMEKPERGRAFGKKNRELRRALDELAEATTDEGRSLAGLGQGPAAMAPLKDAATVRWIKNVTTAKQQGKPLLVKYYAKRLPVAAQRDPTLADTLTAFVANGAT